MRRIVFSTILLTSLLFAPALAAEEPMEMVKENVNKVLDVLRNKSLSREAKTDRLEAIYKTMFDEVELSRRSLGRNWNKLNPEQQKEFISLFRQILENAYIDRILAYTNEKIEFLKEVKAGADRAEVRTQVITSTGQVPIYYRVIRKDGNWRVYDVIIENVSLVQNYRSQFRSILARGSTEELLETVRKRAKQKAKYS
jgi:phospholipid transport system substrate-binding protein